ncbi:MAG: carboxypeptidase-like regulatory domain-containing protein, partial [Saprospiraceae bacterium]|nr:carboxypeptidase-like regulatory domain-containing protein [Saprospiraceae bacterium]
MNINDINGQTLNLTIPVSGACDMCKDRIETTAKNVIGVIDASYDLEKKILTIEAQPIFQRSELVNALLKVGHDTDGQKSPDEIYESLPACCYYREEDHARDDERHNQEVNDTHDHENAAKQLKGVVYERLESGGLIPIIGANIIWQGEKGGAISDLKGNFEIPVSEISKNLIVSYVGYSPDTVLIDKSGFVNIIISSPNLLDAVTITHKKRTTEISYLETVKVQNISSKELLKAACCNLAESFDTTPAVDASMTDAITGTRKIEMLGLAGPYVQITRENIPDVRGLAALQGL